MSIDVAWSPNCIDKRCYDYASLAKASDFMVVMSYDERSQIYRDCIASANSAFNQTFTGKWTNISYNFVEILIYTTLSAHVWQFHVFRT